MPDERSHHSELVAVVRRTHAKAMEALAADVHPYSGPAIRDWEKEMEAALDSLVEQFEAAGVEIERLENELFKLDEWASRMPDAGFTSDDPRWDWWHRRPRVISIPASIREEVRTIKGPLSPDELEETVTRALDSFGGSSPAREPEA